MSANRIFTLSCPALSFCENVEASSYADAMSAIRISGYFDQAFEEMLSAVESAALFSPEGLLEVHVFDNRTCKTATYELSLGFVVRGLDTGDIIFPRGVGE